MAHALEASKARPPNLAESQNQFPQLAEPGNVPQAFVGYPGFGKVEPPQTP